VRVSAETRLKKWRFMNRKKIIIIVAVAILAIAGIAYVVTSLTRGTGGLPLAPRDLSITSINSTTINITWTKGVAADRTIVRMSGDNYPSYPLEGLLVYSGSGTYVVVEVFDFTTAAHYYSIWSENELGYSESYVTGLPEEDKFDLREGFGIYGSEVKFSGVYPGWSGNVTLTIINGNDRDRLFAIHVSESTKLADGYEAFPEEYFYWITIQEPSFNTAVGEKREVLFTLTMPEDADYSGKKAGVGIRVQDLSQTGLVQIELESKWYIITA